MNVRNLIAAVANIVTPNRSLYTAQQVAERNAILAPDYKKIAAFANAR
jgi:hypothetical protein